MPARRIALPWKTFQLRTRSSTADATVLVGADARRPRRSPRLHAAVRPRARGRARPRRAPRSSSSRRPSASARVPRRTATRSTKRSTARSAGSAAPALRLPLQGARAPARHAPRCSRAPADVAPPPVARRARARRAAAPPAQRRSSSRRTTCFPRRTARRPRSGAACSRASTGSSCTRERGRETLAAFGVADERLRVIPHPVFRSDPPRADDGRTVLALGVIRPYKGLEDALEATLGASRRAPARRGRPPHPARRPPRRAAGDRAEWRLGYLSPTRARARARRRRPSPSSRTAPSSTSRARSSRRSAPACPPSSTTSAGSARSCGASTPAASSRRATSTALAAALRELLDDPAALAASRAERPRARETLTWDAAAAAHLALYEELA